MILTTIQTANKISKYKTSFRLRPGEVKDRVNPTFQFVARVRWPFIPASCPAGAAKPHNYQQSRGHPR
jgi:hypothetical protein